jgi:K+-transporting ATPase c subunit
MELFALSDAVTTTVVALLIWAVLFPAFVTALIALALVRAYGEKLENDEYRRGRRRST